MIAVTETLPEDEVVDYYREILLPKADLVVYEEWRLYASAASTMTGSDFPEAQLIGVLRYLAEEAKVPIVGIKAAEHKAFFKIGVRDYEEIGSRHEADALQIALFGLLFRADLTDAAQKAILRVYKGVDV